MRKLGCGYWTILICHPGFLLVTSHFRFVTPDLFRGRLFYCHPKQWLDASASPLHDASTSSKTVTGRIGFASAWRQHFVLYNTNCSLKAMFFIAFVVFYAFSPFFFRAELYTFFIWNVCPYFFCSSHLPRLFRRVTMQRLVLMSLQSFPKKNVV